MVGNAVTANRVIIAGALLALLSISGLVNGVRKGGVNSADHTVGSIGAVSQSVSGQASPQADWRRYSVWQ